MIEWTLERASRRCETAAHKNEIQVWIFRPGTYSILEQTTARGGLRETKKRRKTRILVLPVFYTIKSLRSDRNRKCADEDLACQTTELLIGLAADSGDDRVVASPGSCVVQGVAAHEENLRQFLIVVGHHGWPGRLLRHRQKVVYILDRSERLLPELELNGSVQLREPGVKMTLERLRVLKVDGMRLVCVFGYIGKMESQSFAEATELDFSLVLQAELEGLLGDLLHSTFRTTVYRNNQLLGRT